MIRFKYVDQNLSARSSVFSSLGATTLVRLRVIRTEFGGVATRLDGRTIYPAFRKSWVRTFPMAPDASRNNFTLCQITIEITGNLQFTLLVVLGKLSQNVRSQLVDQNQQLEPEFQKSKESVKSTD